MSRPVAENGPRVAVTVFSYPASTSSRSFEWIRIAPPGYGDRPECDFELPMEVPGSVELPGSGSRITLQVLEKDRRVSRIRRAALCYSGE